jgi:hypothetical protein
MKKHKVKKAASPEPPGLSKIDEMFSPEQLQAIGTLTVVGGMFEQVIAVHLARLICHPNPMGKWLSEDMLNGPLARMSVSKRLKAMKLFIEATATADHKKEIIKQIEKLRKAYKRRNEFAHNIIYTEAGVDKVKLMTYSVREGDKAQIYNTRQIRSFAEKISTLVYRLDELLTAAGYRKLEEQP